MPEYFTRFQHQFIFMSFNFAISQKFSTCSDDDDGKIIKTIYTSYMEKKEKSFQLFYESDKNQKVKIYYYTNESTTKTKTSRGETFNNCLLLRLNCSFIAKQYYILLDFNLRPEF